MENLTLDFAVLYMYYNSEHNIVMPMHVAENISLQWWYIQWEHSKVKDYFTQTDQLSRKEELIQCVTKGDW